MSSLEHIFCMAILSDLCWLQCCFNGIWAETRIVPKTVAWKTSSCTTQGISPNHPLTSLSSSPIHRKPSFSPHLFIITHPMQGNKNQAVDARPSKPDQGNSVGTPQRSDGVVRSISVPRGHFNSLMNLGSRRALDFTSLKNGGLIHH